MRLDSWKLWELDPNQARRTGIKTLAYEWLRQYVFKSILSHRTEKLKPFELIQRDESYPI